MSDITQVLREKLALAQGPSESELCVRRSVHPAETLPARAIGYSWGQRDESERLAPLHEAIIDVVEAGNKLRDYSDGVLATLDCTSRERYLPDDDWQQAMFLRDQYDKALARLKLACAEGETT